jgi:uncharacterized membrane protein
MSKKFDYKSAIDFALSTTKNNFGFLIGLSVFSGIIVFIGYMIANLTKDNVILNFVFNLGAKLLETFLIMGFMNITLKIVDWQKPVFSDLFSCGHLVIKYIIASVLYYLIVMVGLIFFIIPGFYLAIKYQFYDYFVVDEESGPIEALQNSAKVTEGVKWELIKLSSILVLINLFGFFAFFIGLFITIPFGIMARTYAYRKLIS